VSRSAERWSLAALFLATASVFADMYVTQPLLPILSGEFGVSPAVAGTTISVVVLANALFSTAYGPLGDVLGRKPIMVASCGLLGFVTLSCALAPSFASLLAARAAQGALVPGVSAVAVAYIGDAFAGPRAGAFVGAYISATVTGGLLGRVVSGLVADRFGWRAAFVTFGVLTLAGAAAMWTALREPRRLERLGPVPDFGAAYRAMGSNLADVRLFGAFLVGATLFFGFIGIFTYLPYYLSAAPFRLSTGAISWFFAAYIAGVVVSPIAGRMSTRVPQRALIALGIAIAAGGMALTLRQSLASIAAGVIILCLGMFTAQSVAPAFVNRIATHAKGGANALYHTFYYVGAVFGSTLPGLAWQRFAWPGVVATCLAGLAVALLSDWLLCAPRRRRLGEPRFESAPR
jgi:YNFM family putative membrane transporter